MRLRYRTVTDSDSKSLTKQTNISIYNHPDKKSGLIKVRT